MKDPHDGPYLLSINKDRVKTEELSWEDVVEISKVAMRRYSYIEHGLCIPPPLGCGNPVDEFRDELSRQEYQQSGLCQRCQDRFFGTETK